jgi:hypothetical protein
MEPRSAGLLDHAKHLEKGTRYCSECHTPEHLGQYLFVI